MVKKFGLREARMLAREPEAHFPTVKATLKILGVANVVKEEALRFIVVARAAIGSANEKKASILRNDTADQKQVEKKVVEMNTARAARAVGNTALVAEKVAIIEAENASIKELKELAEKFEFA